MGVFFLNELMCQITQHAAEVLHFIQCLQGSTEWNLQVFRVLKMTLCFLAQKQKSWGWRWEMDCHLGNLMTSCFPVMCVEKCLVASRLCPGISPCTQVRQGLPVVVTALWNSLGFVLGRRKMVRRRVCEPSLAHLEQSSAGTGHNVRAGSGSERVISLQPTWNFSLQNLSVEVCPGSSKPDCRYQRVTKPGNGVLKRRHSLFFDGFGVFFGQKYHSPDELLSVTEQQKIWPWCFRSVKLKYWITHSSSVPSYSFKRNRGCSTPFPLS